MIEREPFAKRRETSSKVSRAAKVRAALAAARSCHSRDCVLSGGDGACACFSGLEHGR